MAAGLPRKHLDGSRAFWHCFDIKGAVQGKPIRTGQRMATRVFGTAVSVLIAFPVFAGQIEQACLKSDRGYGQRALCTCIQDAANMTLTPGDQRLAATFFADPNRAQEVRQSRRRQHEAFWERYENFGVAAETFCRR